MSEFLENLFLPLHYFTNIQERIHYQYLANAFLIALPVYFFNRQTHQRKTAVGLFRYVLPWRIYFHKSAINDYLFFFSSILLAATFITPLFTFVTINVAMFVKQYLVEFNLFPTWENSIQSGSIYLALGVTLFIAIISDFAIFFIHLLQHRIPWLWEFHKVHHSAEVLTPITVYRMHPVDNFLTFSFSGLLIGSAIGFFQFIFKSDPAIYNVAGTNLIFIVFYLFGYNLRHSHIWLSYGPYLSKILISPAQHQIHHSMDSKHIDKNMGFIFSFWDLLFGTLYVPKQKETIKFGITQEENAQFSSFWSLYLMPFSNLFKKFKLIDSLKLNKIVSVIFFFMITGSAMYFSSEKVGNQQGSQSLFMEEMTWREIQKAIDNGYTTVLIPTGGTEQNGPHLILGKHNHIVKYTSGRIAQSLGGTLVAPTITYVPEGRINPPDGHMRFAGTLSLEDQAFASLLKSSARSLKTHGFKFIAFIGESGGNQEIQGEVAKELDQLWQAKGVRVLHVDDYYLGNGQIRFLLNEGYTLEEIGGHAGIRDTSELMRVYPEGVRKSLLADNSKSEFTETGADGDSRKANISLGKVLLEMKINAAISQISKQLKRID